jgi:cytochrome c biogenesis protein CcdA
MMPFLVALLIGLKHATDPDHLTAVSTLVLGQEREGVRRAATLGLAWGAGHATTLFSLGLPVVLFSRLLPEPVHHAAEMLVGLVIIALALRLLLRWRAGYFHVHPHSHGSVLHVHPHAHSHAHTTTEEPVEHSHPHSEALGRSPLAAFGIGLLHGLGGSAGAGVLVIGSSSSPVKGTLALLLFAVGTAASMAVVSAAFAYTLGRGRVKAQLADLVPVFAAASLLFGVWYSLGAIRGSA